MFFSHPPQSTLSGKKSALAPHTGPFHTHSAEYSQVASARMRSSATGGGPRPFRAHGEASPANETRPATNHQNKSSYEPADSDSCTCILINPIPPSHQKSSDDKHITAREKCPLMEGERGGGLERRGAVRSLVERAAASGINITARCSAKYLIFYPIALRVCLLFQIPANISALHPVTLFAPSCPNGPNCQRVIRVREKKIILTKPVPLYPST